MTDSIRVSAVIPSTPTQVYAAWLDGDTHARMTGGAASVDAQPGGAHSAWDGYISGRVVALEPGRRIVKTWRTTEFPADAPDSTLEIRLAPAKGGTRVTLSHSGIPDGQGKQYRSGWHSHYFKPMIAWFGAQAKDESATAEALPAATAKPRQARAAKANAPAAEAKAPAAKATAPAAKASAPAARAKASASKANAPAVEVKASAATAKPRKAAKATAKSRKAAKATAKSRKAAKATAKPRKAAKATAKSRKASKATAKPRKAAKAKAKSRKAAKAKAQPRKAAKAKAKPRKAAKAKARARKA